MKVIRSPIVFEAELFHSKGIIPKSAIPQNDYYFIVSKYGHLVLNDGDWIVKGESGWPERYSEEEFRRIFERYE